VAKAAGFRARRVHYNSIIYRKFSYSITAGRPGAMPHSKELREKITRHVIPLRLLTVKPAGTDYRAEVEPGSFGDSCMLRMYQ
jgi:hypothetical protein